MPTTTSQSTLGFPRLKLLGLALIFGGLGLIAWGVVQQQSLPAEIERGEPGWFESRRERNDQEFTATGKLMFGAFIALTGAMLAVYGSRRVQQRALDVSSAVLQQGARAVAQGFQSAASHQAAARTPAERLEELTRLRAGSLITEDEYAIQRKQILADV